MSTLKVNSIVNTSNKKLLNNSGNIVQTIHARTDARNTWSAPNSYIFTPVTSLTLTITPQHPNNLIVVQLCLSGEIHHDTVITILRDYGKDESLPYGVDANGFYNFNPRHSGMVAGDYTGDDNGSTPRNYFLQGTWQANTLSQIRFTPGVRSSNGSNRTLYLNRTQGSSGQNSHEICYSSLIAFEVSRG
jgi:hypothetical protein